MSDFAATAVPQHVAFIMDGNGRWAQKQGWQRLVGHKAGIETVQKILKESMERRIKFVTFYAFSSENWRRPEAEVKGLFSLMQQYFKAELNKLISENIKVQFIGDRAPGSKLSPKIIEIMNEVEEKTANNTAITATFAINYGARNELTRAAAELAQQEQEEGKVTPYHSENLGQFLDTVSLPDVDLMIRTGGEQRLSNFMLWQLAYAELYFTPVFWPDFDAANYQAALDNFANRQRRFGGLVDAVDSTSHNVEDVEEL